MNIRAKKVNGNGNEYSLRLSNIILSNIVNADLNYLFILPLYLSKLSKVNLTKRKRTIKPLESVY